LNFIKRSTCYWKRFWNPIHPSSCISAKTGSFSFIFDRFLCRRYCTLVTSIV